MESSVSRHQVIHVTHGPPDDEMPVVLATPDLVWHGDGIVVAIPSLLVYTTGAEITIMARTRHGHMNDDEHSRASRTALTALKASNIRVTMLGGQHQEHGFTYRGWIPLGAGPEDVAVSFGWPAAGIADSEIRIAGQKLAHAAARAVVLWRPAATGREESPSPRRLWRT